MHEKFSFSLFFHITYTYYCWNESNDFIIQIDYNKFIIKTRAGPKYIIHCW